MTGDITAIAELRVSVLRPLGPTSGKLLQGLRDIWGVAARYARGLRADNGFGRSGRPIFRYRWGLPHPFAITRVLALQEAPARQAGRRVRLRGPAALCRLLPRAGPVRLS